jgi:hypothetical protein
MKMIQRCTNPADIGWHRYGGRGITVCTRWRESFADFYADMGNRPVGTTLDRINNDLGYEPGNCRWSSRTVQARNSRNARMLTFNGQSRSMSEWSELLGLNIGTVWKRLDKGWTVERALSTPINRRRQEHR